jgi:hypothetical protein
MEQWRQYNRTVSKSLDHVRVNRPTSIITGVWVPAPYACIVMMAYTDRSGTDIVTILNAASRHETTERVEFGSSNYNEALEAWRKACV